MLHRDYFVNSKKMNIKVIPYLILEHMHYNKVKLDIFKPQISYLGISRKLYDFYMSDLMSKKLIKKVGNKYELTSTSQKRLEGYLKDKTFFLEKFEVFWKLYPLNTDKKKAQLKWFGIDLNQEKFNEIINGTKRQIEERSKILAKDPNKFIPEWTNPATYLFNERWNDELIPKSNVKKEVKNVYQKEKL